MASDKLMNHTQGETIIGKLTSIAASLDDLAAVTPAKLGMGIATCDTPASTAAKTAALANFALVEGAPVSVQFLYANTADNATLNINNTGAKPIIYKDAAIGNDVISAGDTCTFIYTTNTYKITNIDTLTGPGSGTVRQVGAENGLITDQSDNADIQTTGKIGLNLKSDTAFSTEAPDPVEIEDKIYPVALDAAGHPAVSVPGTEYTQGAGINISENNVITNTGVFDVTAPTSSDTTATNGDIKVIKKVVNNGVTTESVEFVKPKGINDPAFKALDSSTSGLTSDDNHVPTSKTVQDAIDTALASASVYKGTISAFNDLPTSTPTDTVRKGWYYRVSTAWSAATGTPATHVGDIIIAEKDSPSKAIDSANWSLLHNEANTDANVTQSPVSTNANYEVLFSGSADNTSHTEGTGKDSGLTYNPSTNKLTVSGEVSATSYSGLPEGNTTTKGIVQLGTDADKAASGNHVHGNITNGGALQTTDVDIASGDKLVITDASDSNKVARASVSFDGSTATQALTKKGTFENFQAPISASNKLSSDFVDDTNKTHRFATADQLTQIATNKTNILSVEDMICDTEFSTSTAYAVGDIVTHEHGLYKFNTAHSAGAWNSSQVDEVSAVDLISSGDGTDSVASKEIYVTKPINQPDTWETKTWTGLTAVAGSYIWTDGTDIYYSAGSTQKVLDKSTSTWNDKTWTGISPMFLFVANGIWTDGTDIYYSASSTQKVLDKSTSTWNDKTWTGLISFIGQYVWTDGIDVFYSDGSSQYVLNKATSTWSTKTWSGLTEFSGQYVWTDGTDIYYSYGSDQYVLDKSTSVWATKTWTGLTTFSGQNIWTVDDNIYYSSDSSQYVLNKATSTWETKTWSELTSFGGDYIWTDGADIYYSYGSDQYVLKRPLKTTKIPDVKNNAQLTALIGDINSVLEAVL